MNSIAAKRIDRMLTFRPMPLSKLAKVELKYSRVNECASGFVKDLVPLMAYGNKHIEFKTQTLETEEPEYCNLLMSKVS
ncbi:hypothetical protein BaOVIS_023020 [Babesia ovis]|uniref:Uncharacterized protein n=1 Tax=Babesia ovis TaxID=5869 RepID=A0A9W5WVF4_BABOV|nr:hypothetical protein BaOVIS_023020 [Babesia ovis]